MIQTFNIKPIGRIDRRSPTNEGEMTDVLVRENLLSRDGKITKIRGTEKFGTDVLTSQPTWLGRYYSIETGIDTPKTFMYTNDGKMWRVDNNSGLKVELNNTFGLKGFPKPATFKLNTQTIMYLIDGTYLWKYNGNNDGIWTKVDLTYSDGGSVSPIDVVEHKDRLCVLSETHLFISANLNPDNFTDALDSLDIVVGTGKGKNLALGKIRDYLFIFNTEGIYMLRGDTISAVASTFSIDLVDERKIVSSRSVVEVENALIFLGLNNGEIELYSFNGSTSKLLSYKERLTDFINPSREFLDKAVATYEDNYYKLSFVENGMTYNNLEIWWDAIEDKIEFIRGRNISCYMSTDPTKEPYTKFFSRSDIGAVMIADRGYSFDGQPIPLKLTTKDWTVKKDRNVRFTAFYPELEPHGARSMFLRYLLDSRLSETSDYSKDILLNPDFEAWSDATSPQPHKWTIGAGNTATRETILKQHGLYSLKLSGGAETTTTQLLLDPTKYRGKILKLAGWVYAGSSNKTQLSINDGTTTSSSKNTLTTTWELLTVSKTISTTATSITIGLWVTTGAGAKYFDNLSLTVTEETSNDTFSLDGEHKQVGYWVNISNQAEIITRVQPRINFAVGRSVRLELYDATPNMDFTLLGFSIDFIDKFKKKSVKVGA